MALKPVLKVKVDALFLRWLSEPETQQALRENLQQIAHGEALTQPSPRSMMHRPNSPRHRPGSPTLSTSASKLPSPRSPRRPLSTKNNHKHAVITSSDGKMQSEAEDGDAEILEAEEVEEEMDPPPAVSPGSAAPGMCHHCGKSFGQYKHLKRHIKNIHYTGEPVVCPEPGCRKSFRRPELLESHQKNIHSDEKAFECQKCKKKFAMRKDLTQHSHSCGGLKPYACNFCTMCFSSRSSLADHRRRSHEGRRYVCGGCTKVYKWKCSRKRHCKKCPRVE